MVDAMDVRMLGPLKNADPGLMWRCATNTIMPLAVGVGTYSLYSLY
jgi:hypothetical protein